MENQNSGSVREIGISDMEGLDILRFGPAVNAKGDPTGYLALSGALIHIDIDTKGEGATFTNVFDAILHVGKVMNKKNWTGYLYATHNGVRLLLTHRLSLPNDAREEIKAFHIDPIYKSACKSLNEWRIRITPKMNRDEVKVATLLKKFGKGIDIAESLVSIHDRICT